ncbi:hypothetical protein [Pollutibacter soli]|uniref:hypothetical protein n=1 Tax=Pollutibacter soli TaxID=3034157 RepID=UPI0030137AF9
MYKKLNQLSFVIGLFFTIVAVILLLNNWLTVGGGKISLYTAVVFAVFGVGMMGVRGRE